MSKVPGLGAKERAITLAGVGDRVRVIRGQLHHAGAPMQNLTQSASLHSNVKNAPSKPGTKYLVHKLQVVRDSIEVTSQPSSHETAPKGPVTTYAYQKGSQVAVPAVALEIGDVVLVGLQTELAASLGMRIKSRSPYPHTVVATMIDGAAKYMPDARSYDRFTCEARSSPCAKGSGEVLADAVTALLKRMTAEHGSGP